jgi:DNA-binding transcriptional ArsR family regulator
LATRAVAWAGADFERAAEVFSLLSTPSRLRLLGALCEGEKCVGDLAEATGLPQPTVSQQLSLMFRAGLLARRREGVQVHYRVDEKTRGFLCRAVRALVI